MKAPIITDPGAVKGGGLSGLLDSPITFHFTQTIFQIQNKKFLYIFLYIFPLSLSAKNY